MKTVNKICQILAVVFSVVSLALFFTKFATIVSGGANVDFVGAALGFGSKKELADGAVVDMARSADILFCFWLTVIGVVLSVFAFKSKTVRYFAPAFGLGTGIYMLVIALSNPWKFVDTRPLANVTAVSYSAFVLLTAISLFVFAAFAVAYLLIDDYLEVMESKGKKLTIPKRVILFLRDYKSEIKKIVWPGFKDVVKNTIIVLIMCLLVGILIWLLDFGLGRLLELILGQ